MYIAVLVVVASAAGQSIRLVGRASPRRVRGVPVRTVGRWVSWWQTVFAMGAFWLEANAFLASPVAAEELPASLLARFGTGTNALEKMLRFTAPITTTSLRVRTAMVL